MKPGFDTIIRPAATRDTRVLRLHESTHEVVPMQVSRRRKQRASLQVRAYVGLIAVLALGTGHQAVRVADIGNVFHPSIAQTQPISVATGQTATANSGETSWELVGWTDLQQLLRSPSVFATSASQNDESIASVVALPSPLGSTHGLTPSSPASTKTAHPSQVALIPTVSTSVKSVATVVGSTLPTAGGKPITLPVTPPAQSSPNPPAGSGGTSSGSTGNGGAPVPTPPVITPTPTPTPTPSQPIGVLGGINRIITGISQLLGLLRF